MNSYELLADRAERLMPALREWAVRAPYERKGILHSEILFLLAVLDGVRFGRLLESGRARGQSTLMLSLALPDHEIVSVEFDRNSDDVAVAEARLRDRPNVKLLYGDARRILPEIAQDDDVVLIDGPKGFRSVRLALQLLASGRISHVFVHDLAIGTPERRFVDANFPEARFSDCRDFAKVSHLADSGLDDVIPQKLRLDGFHGRFGYGFSLTALPRRPGRPYRWLLFKARIADLMTRLVRRHKKRRSPCESS